MNWRHITKWFLPLMALLTACATHAQLPLNPPVPPVVPWTYGYDQSGVGSTYFPGNIYGNFKVSNLIISGQINTATVKWVDLLGAAGDGITDDSSIINNTISSFGTGGGTVCLTPGKTYAIANTVFMGNGASNVPSTINSVTMATCDIHGLISDGNQGSDATLLWTGAASGVMVQQRGRANGLNLSSINLSGNGSAATLLKIVGVAHSEYKHLWGSNWTGTGIIITTNCPDGIHAGSAWNLYNDVNLISPANTNTSNGILLDGCGGSNIDATQSIYDGLEVYYGGGPSTYGIKLGFADGNFFRNMVVSANTYGLGGLDIQFAQDPTLTLYPTNNIFYAYPLFPNGIGGTPGTGGGNFFSNFVTTNGGAAAFPNIIGISGTNSAGEMYGRLSGSVSQNGFNLRTSDSNTSAGILTFGSNKNGILSATSASALQINGAGYGTVNINGPVVTTKYTRLTLQTLSALNAADPTPQAGDRASISDATACTANTSVTGGGAVTCSVIYSGTAWKAIVTQ